MFIKRYTIAAFIFIVFVGWYVYAFITQDNIGINLFGIEIPSLSIALLVSLPIVVFYFASVAHMSFYSILNSFKLRKYEKDYEKLIETIIDAYLGKENRNHIFKTPRYELLGSLIDNTTLFASKNITPNTSNEKINDVLKVIESVKNGELVDLKKYSLSPSNAFVLQNNRNLYKQGKISSEDILSNPTKYDISLAKETYIEFVKTSPLYAIEQYKEFLTKESLFEILARVNASENTLEIPNETLILFFEKLELTTKEYIQASTILSLGMLPEQRIKLFESMSENKDEAAEAYLYTLFDLEMIAPADEILDNSLAEDYLKFKAYRSLKECNKNFNINLFI